MKLVFYRMANLLKISLGLLVHYVKLTIMKYFLNPGTRNSSSFVNPKKYLKFAGRRTKHFFMKTIPSFFEAYAERFKNNVLMWEKKDGPYQGLTYSEMRRLVHRFAGGLLSLGLNVATVLPCFRKAETIG
jgi:hypothetical protein